LFAKLHERSILQKFLALPTRNIRSLPTTVLLRVQATIRSQRLAILLQRIVIEENKLQRVVILS